MGQEHNLLSVSIESVAELTQPALFQPQEETLLADDVESISELTTPTLREGAGDFLDGNGAMIFSYKGQYYSTKTGE